MYRDKFNVPKENVVRLLLDEAVIPHDTTPAEVRAIRPSVVLRSDPLVIALGTMQGKSPAQLDTFFNTYGQA